MPWITQAAAVPFPAETRGPPVLNHSLTLVAPFGAATVRERSGYV